MNTANWVPDLFMERVMNDGNGPCSLPTRHPICTIYTVRPSKRPEAHERKAENGEIRNFRKLRAMHLWRVLTMLFGRPSLDRVQGSMQHRSPQNHVGVVHLESMHEITPNTSRDETAVCNLGRSTWPPMSAKKALIATSWRKP